MFSTSSIIDRNSICLQWDLLSLSDPKVNTTNGGWHSILNATGCIRR